MTLDTVMLGADGSESSKKSAFFRGFVSAFLAGLLFVAIARTSYNSSDPIEMNAIGFSGAGLRAPRANTLGAHTAFRPQLNRAKQEMMSGINADPLARLAVSVINANTRCQVSAKAEAEGAKEIKAEEETMPKEAKETVDEIKKAVKLKAEDMAGVTEPMGFFDPAGYATDTPVGKLLFYREAELKHGRVCMLASLGILVGEKFHPLFGGDIDVPAYVAFQQTPLQTFWPVVLAAMASVEAFSVFTFKSPDNDGNFWMVKEGRVPGDLGYDPLGIKPSDPAEFKEMQNKEINNGRLAMFATAGLIAQELATGQKIFPEGAAGAMSSSSFR